MNNDELLVLIKDMFEKKTEEMKRELKEEMSGLRLEIRDVKNHTGVMIEGLKGDIRAIAEGHSLLDKKLDDTRNELKAEIKIVKDDMKVIRNELKTEINEVKDDMKVIRDFVTGVDKKLNEHEVILNRAK